MIDRKTILRQGFTIIELLVVLSVIALLLSLLIPSLLAAREVASSAVCLSDQRQVQIAVSSYGNCIWIPPAFNSSAGPNGIATYWDDILFRDGLFSSVKVLNCPKAIKQSGISYVIPDPIEGLIVNSCYRQGAPPPQADGSPSPNSNYNVNGGWQGGGDIDVPYVGFFGANFLHPYRYVIPPWDAGNPTYALTAPWQIPGDWANINGYTAFYRPMKEDEVPSPVDTISIEDGGWLQNPEYMAPRHGGGQAADSIYADVGQWMNVAWMDGHASSLKRGHVRNYPWIDLVPATWTGSNYWCMNIRIPGT